MNRNELTRARTALSFAIAKLGGTVETAEALGITPAAVSQWDICPPARVAELSRLTGISRHDLRPDWHGQGGER